MKLDIYLPTYQRKESLAKTLDVLVPQILGRKDVRLTILDNASLDKNGNELVYDLPLSSQVRFSRNPQNIGGCANFLKGFQEATAEWIWVLSDDDEVMPNAVETIFSRMRCDVDYITFAIPIANALTNLPEPVRGHGVADLLALFDQQLMVAVFVSSSIYRVDVMKRYLRDGFDGIYSGISQTILAFRSIEEGSQWMACPECIVDYVVPEESQWWDRFNIFSRLPEVEMIFREDDTRRAIRSAITHCRQIDPEMAAYYVKKRFGEKNVDLKLYFLKLFRFYCPAEQEDSALYERWIQQLKNLSGVMPGREHLFTYEHTDKLEWQKKFEDLARQIGVLSDVVKRERDYESLYYQEHKEKVSLQGSIEALNEQIFVLDNELKKSTTFESLYLQECKDKLGWQEKAASLSNEILALHDVVKGARDYQIENEAEIDRLRQELVRTQEEGARRHVEAIKLSTETENLRADTANLREVVSGAAEYQRELEDLLANQKAELEKELRSKLIDFCQSRGFGGKFSGRYWLLKLQIWAVRRL